MPERVVASPREKTPAAAFRVGLVGQTNLSGVTALPQLSCRPLHADCPASQKEFVLQEYQLLAPRNLTAKFTAVLFSH